MRWMAVVALLLATRTAAAEVPVQGGVYGGIDCGQGCGSPQPLAGANVFGLLGRVGALGGLAEYVHRADEFSTAVVRVGPAFRAYPVRGGRYEPFVQLALGPLWFKQRTPHCTADGMFFLQAGAGVEARVFEQAFVGAAVIGTLELRAKSCGFNAGGGSTGTPSYGNERPYGVSAFVLSFRYGPSLGDDRTAQISGARGRGPAGSGSVAPRPR